MYAPVWVESIFSKDDDTNEALMAKFLDKLCDIIAPHLPSHYRKNRRSWTGDYCLLPLNADAVDIQRKPDLVALKKRFDKERFKTFLHRLKWLNVDIVGELKAFIA